MNFKEIGQEAGRRKLAMFDSIVRGGFPAAEDAAAEILRRSTKLSTMANWLHIATVMAIKNEFFGLHNGRCGFFGPFIELDNEQVRSIDPLVPVQHGRRMLYVFSFNCSERYMRWEYAPFVDV